MLEDRDYMRQPAYREPRISFTIALLIVNAVCFMIQLVAWQMPDGAGAEFQDQYLALSLDGLKSGYVWELLTFQFMHVSIWHILFNSLAIFFFGRAVETAIGGKRFLLLYFSSGVAGGLVQMLFALFISSFDGPVFGASAGAAGLVAAFAVLHWEEPFTLFIYFLPVNMRGKTLFWGSIVVVLASMMIPNNVANAAHLGGILAGFFCARLMLGGNWPQWKFPERRAAPREFAAAGKSKKGFWHSSSAKPGEDLSDDEFLQTEVDPILDKISAHGIQSLTAREREILEKARSKITKR